MSITKQAGSYKLDFYQNGRNGKRIVKLFKTKREAQDYQKGVLAGKTQNTKAR